MDWKKNDLCRDGHFTARSTPIQSPSCSDQGFGKYLRFGTDNEKYFKKKIADQDGIGDLGVLASILGPRFILIIKKKYIFIFIYLNYYG